MNTTCPSGYFISLPPDASDTGWLLFTILVPAFFICIFLIGFMAYLNDANTWRNMGEGPQCICGGCTYIVIACFMISVGLVCVHTPREILVGYYNEIAADWVNRGGMLNMNSCGAFRLSSTASFPASNAAAILPINTKISKPVQAAGPYSEGIAAATSVTFTTQIIPPANSSQYRYFGTYLASSVGGGAAPTPGDADFTYINIGSSPFAYNVTDSQWLICGDSFCTSSCDEDDKSNYGECYIGTAKSTPTPSESPLRAWCAARNGVWTPRLSSNYVNCEYGTTCGRCDYPKYLQKMCFLVDRTSSGFVLSAKFSGCNPPFTRSYPYGIGSVYVSAVDVAAPPTSVAVQVMSVSDPGFRLSLITDGTNTFSISTWAKYTFPGIIMWGVTVFLGIMTWLWVAHRENWCCFGDDCCECRCCDGDSCCCSCGCPCCDEDDDYLDITDGETRNLLGTNNNHNIGTSQESLAREILCQICFENPRDRKFLPCNHHMACSECAARMLGQPCPLCRRQVEASEYCRPEDPTFAVFERGNSSSDGSSSADNNNNNNNNDNDDDAQSVRSRGAGSSNGRNYTCTICLENARDRVFRPCGHHCTCSECAPLFIGRPCPICRQVVSNHEFCDPQMPTFVRF